MFLFTRGVVSFLSIIHFHPVSYSAAAFSKHKISIFVMAEVSSEEQKPRPQYILLEGIVINYMRAYRLNIQFLIDFALTNNEAALLISEFPKL